MADFSWVPQELEGRFSYVNNKLMASCEKCGAMRHTSGRGRVLSEIEKGHLEKYRLCGTCGKYKGYKPTKEDIASWPEGCKRCTHCKEIKPFADFHKHKTALYGYNTVCKACRLPISKDSWSSLTTEVKLYQWAKSRARAKGREFSISVEDIVIPETCPILAVRLDESHGDFAPSLDRIDSRLGYIPGNVQVVSKRGNTLKNNMSLEEARAVYNYMSDLITAK